MTEKDNRLEKLEERVEKLEKATSKNEEVEKLEEKIKQMEEDKKFSEMRSAMNKLSDAIKSPKEASTKDMISMMLEMNKQQSDFKDALKKEKEETSSQKLIKELVGTTTDALKPAIDNWVNTMENDRKQREENRTKILQESKVLKKENKTMKDLKAFKEELEKINNKRYFDSKKEEIEPLRKLGFEINDYDKLSDDEKKLLDDMFYLMTSLQLHEDC